MSESYIVFLDDDEEITMIMAEIFEDSDFKAATFNDPQEALNFISNNPIRCVITDLKMPKMDGFEFFNQFKKVNTDDIPIVLLSGHADVKITDKAKAIGFSQVMEKPFDRKYLINTVKRLTTKT